MLLAFNQGEVCTCPSRAVIQEDIREEFIARRIDRARAIKQGDPRDTATMVGAQVNRRRHDRIMSCLQIGRDEGAKVLVGGGAASLTGELEHGFHIQPTILRGRNRMRVFQGEIFGPVVSVTILKDEVEAMRIAKDTMYSLGAGVWTRDGNRACRFGRAIAARASG